MTRPGFKTTEFWLTALAQIVSLLFASGVIRDGSTIDTALGIIAAVLASAGYSVSRGLAKAGEAKALRE